MGVAGNMHNLRHGEASGNRVTPEYKAWESMHQRCTNPNSPSYENYGARGIDVCARWRRFEKFLEDVGRRPTPKYSLDRRDNEKGYSPKNCRWATPEEQQGNTRNNRKLTFHGKTRILTDWARDVGISVMALWRRLERGWSVERALTEPLVGKKRPELRALVERAGYKNVNVFLREENVSPATFYKLANGGKITERTRARLSALLGCEL